jgi:hypothetical protein
MSSSASTIIQGRRSSFNSSRLWLLLLSQLPPPSLSSLLSLAVAAPALLKLPLASVSLLVIRPVARAVTFKEYE